MNKWLRRVRGAIGMGVTWAFGWAIAGVSIGVASLLFPGLPWDAFFNVFDAPLPAFAVPGFFAGVFFSIVLGIAARGRQLEEISLSRVAAWGAVGGLLLTAFPFSLVAVGLASREGSSVGTWQILLVITGPFVVLSAVSATVSVILARRARTSSDVLEISSADVLDSTSHDQTTAALSAPQWQDTHVEREQRDRV